jgi:iron complex transport system ATP-binding protein
VFVAENIGLHVSGFDLLQQVDMSVVAGKVTAIVGPNGAGKSSLLRVMTGDLHKTSGDVTLNGKHFAAWGMEQRARVLAVLPQLTPLSFPFTAREVVALGRTPHDTGAHHDRRIIKAALKAVDAEYLDKRFYTQMSGGEKQRVQLARVLAQIWEPVPEGDRFLVLDEPTSAFDLSHQQMTLEIVRDFAAQGVGVLMVLHDLNLAAKCADNLVVISCGKIAAQGTPSQILTRELVHDVFQVDAVISPHPVSGTPMVIT